MGQKRGGESDSSRVDDPVAGRQRLDKWLWFARVVKTRADAVELAERGRVRVNGQRATTAARAVHPGDVLTIAVGQRVLVLKIVGLGERREGYPRARLLYEDLAPAQAASGQTDAHPVLRD